MRATAANAPRRATLSLLRDSRAYALPLVAHLRPPPPPRRFAHHLARLARPKKKRDHWLSSQISRRQSPQRATPAVVLGPTEILGPTEKGQPHASMGRLSGYRESGFPTEVGLGRRRIRHGANTIHQAAHDTAAGMSALGAGGRSGWRRSLGRRRGVGVG